MKAGVAVFILLFIQQISFCQTTFFTGGNICSQGEWQLTFQDEFNDIDLDNNVWYTYYPCNDNWNVPCEEARVAENNLWLEGNVVENNGTLKLVARRESATWVNTTRNYTSGLIFSSSDFRFPFGKYEIRCKVPFGRGLFPSFWLFGGDGNGEGTEIDIFEFQGDRPKYFHPGFYKYRNEDLVAHDDCGFESVDFSLDWHTYSVEWEPFFTTFKIDNEEVCSFTKLFTTAGDQVTWCCVSPGIYVLQPAYPPIKDVKVSIIAGLTIGSGNDSPNDNSIFPAIFEIDYIRVYQRDPPSSDNFDCEVLLFPNPAKQILYIKKNRMTHVKIESIHGQVLFSEDVTGNLVSAEVKDFLKGIYFVEVQSEDGTFAAKFIKD